MFIATMDNWVMLAATGVIQSGWVN